jgi:predicted DsbA family dithiol-disulfide isomerase
LKLGEALKIDLGVFRSCLESEKYKGEIQSDLDVADAAQIDRTPTFVIARTDKSSLDGVRMVGAQPYAKFQIKIDELLQKESAK